MLQPRYNFAAVTVFKRIAVMGGSCPMIDLHDADAVLQYDPKLDMWGYQSLSVVKAAITGSKTPIRRASKMRRRASLGRSLMSTLGVRSKLCAAVIKIPSNTSTRSVFQEVDDFEREFGTVNMPSGLLLPLSSLVICPASITYQPVSATVITPIAPLTPSCDRCQHRLWHCMQRYQLRGC
eukprot:m.234323 g.234323  ORF g.234323 m.234323 type:complete len:180 (+) comp17387_c0_seq31:4600-5139(+)